jgi:hypothetical protein
MKKLSMVPLLMVFIFFYSCKQKDSTPPQVFLNGDNPMTDTLGTVFTDPGATADDNFDGAGITNKIEVTSNIDYITGTPRTKTAGVYTITYSVSDKANNSTSKTRTVNIINSSAKYATTYLFDKTGDDNLFPNFVDLQTTIDYDSRVNNRIYLTKLCNKPGLRIYIDILNDSLIDIPDQYRILTESTVEKLYRVRGEGGQSRIIDNIFFTFVVKYQVEKYDESTISDYDYEADGRYWRSTGNYDVSTELYERL